MDAKKIALLVGALFVAAVTAIMAKSMFGAASAPQAVAAIVAPQPTGPEVLVATKPLPVGTILGPDTVRFQHWPKDLVDGAYYVKGGPDADPIKMQGMVVRTAITAGQPLTQGALVSPHDRGFLAAALTPGMRAVTVPVTGASTVAGLVFPGDRVDVLLTEDVANTDAGMGAALPNGITVTDSRQIHASETVVRNVRVLATDQRTDNVPTPEGKTDIRNFTMVTMEVTPKMAEQIAVAQRLGSISLSLRPLADSSQQLEQAIAAGDVNVPANTDAKAESKMVVDLATRPQSGAGGFTTGAEVSRFARNTGPDLDLVRNAVATRAMQQAAAGGVVHVARGNTVTDTPLGGK